MKPARVLVTGGAGFIGSHLCEALMARGVAVRALDDLSMGRRENVPAGVELVVGDVLDAGTVRRAMEGVDAIAHLAARVSIRASVGEFVADARTNVLGTLEVLRAAADAGVRRLVLASSMAVYGVPERMPQDEEHPLRPASPYGLGKRAAEEYCRMLGRTTGVETVVLRLFNTYGPRQADTPYVGVISIFVRRLLAGRPPVVFGDGGQVRDFVHVADVAEAFARALERDVAGATINVGTGQGTTVNELAARLCARLAPHLAPEHDPEQPGEVRDSLADVRRCRELLGFAPPPRLAERLDEVVAHLRGAAAGPRP